MARAKKQTMSVRIRKMRSENPQMTAKQIADALGTKISYVHTLAYLDKKAGKDVKPLKILRPRKKPVPNPVSRLSPLFAIQPSQSDRLQKLETQIIQYRTAISYLEHQLGLKDSQHGASV